MKENKQIELRSEKVRNIIGRMPPVLVRYGTVMIAAALLVLIGVGAFVPYQPKISIGITASQDEEGTVHYMARIPQRAMAQRNDFSFIVGNPPVEGPMPVKFILLGVPDTLQINRSGGWYEMEIFPVDIDTQAIKIPAPFTFPAKIELCFTTFLKWVMGKGKVNFNKKNA